MKGAVHRVNNMPRSFLDSLLSRRTDMGPALSESLAAAKERIETIPDGSEKKLLTKIVTLKHPIEDADLYEEIDGKSRVTEKAHRSDEPPEPYASGESTSWSFTLSHWVKEKWASVQARTAKALIENDQNQFTELKKDVEKDLDIEVDQMGKTLAKFLPDYMKEKNGKLKSNWRDHLVMTQSGAAAILAGMELTGANHGNVATTEENGSGLMKGLKELVKNTGRKFHTLALRDKQEIDPVDDQHLLEQWRAAIDSGSTFLSVTLTSKTGEVYENVVETVAGWVNDHNSDPRNKNKQITMIVDAVQMIGRVNSHDVFKWLSVKGVAGVAHSGSKAAGGIPHAGFLWLSDEGKRLMDEKIRNQEVDVGQIITDHQVVGSKYLGYEDQQRDHLLTGVRAADNARAVTEVVELGDKNGLYGERAQQFVETYHRFFEFLGFEVRRQREAGSTVLSITALRPPVGLSPEQVNKIMLTELGKRGVALGGYLQEADWDEPILRWGLSVNLLKSSMTPQQLEEKLFGSMDREYIQSLESILDQEKYSEELTSYELADKKLVKRRAFYAKLAKSEGIGMCQKFAQAIHLASQ